MNYFFQLFKSLSVFSTVFILHLLVLGQVLQRASLKLVWQPPKPLMVSFITLPASPVVTSSPATTMPSPILKSEANKVNKPERPKNVKPTQLPTIDRRLPTAKPKKRSSKQSFVPPETPVQPSAKKISPANKADKRNLKRSFIPLETPPQLSAKKISPANKADKRSSKRSLVPLEKQAPPSAKKSIPSKIERGSNVKQNQGGPSQSGIIQKSLTPHPEAITRNTNLDSDSDKGGITTAPSFGAAYLHNPYPPYPSVSQRRGEEGKVLLRVKVTEDGRAATVQINTSSGSQRLDNSALETVSQWRFVPAQKNGKRVSDWVIVPIVFQLN
jgi:protein TonB